MSKTPRKKGIADKDCTTIPLTYETDLMAVAIRITGSGCCR